MSRPRRTTAGGRRWWLPVALAGVVVPAACSNDPATAGVAAVGSDRDDGDRRIVVSLPDDFVLGPGEAAVQAQADERPLPVGEAAPVETLVEPPRPLPDSAVVIGDSLTVAAEAEIERELRSMGLDVLAIDAIESRRIANGGPQLPPGVDAIADVLDAGADPGLWVIALGTNDVGSGGNVDGFRSSIREVTALIPVDAAIVWVDVWIGGRQDAAAEANQAIRVELGGWDGGAAVVDWFGRGAAEDGSITGDGVHLTESGRVAFAEAIAEAIDSLYR
ncbi:MAG: hypothetical protein HKN41_05685 [Ilumatobacter sp.]|nr:hypothetical protein [Ilumatobacter sp.]